jgi:D-amino-acid dehydrogenase
MSMRADVIVLGGGFAGLGAALALQARGRDVVIIDKRGAAGRETSYGNAGLIERASIELYTFPRDISKIASVIFGRAPEARIDWARLPQILPWIARYFFESAPARASAHAQAALPLIQRCLTEHDALAKEAGAEALLRRNGWIKAFSTRASFEEGIVHAQPLLAHQLRFDVLDADALRALEPQAKGFYGAIHYRDPVAVTDPGGLAQAYAALFARRSGRLMAGDALSLEETGQGWRVMTKDGPCAARDVVVALGPWSMDVLRPLRYEIPLGVKRGYHRHFALLEDAQLGHAVLDADGGYLAAPMKMGLRLTTGADFSTRDAPPAYGQIEAAETRARKHFPVGARQGEAWMGARPCLPDLLPVLGPAPRHAGLWFDFGHQHHGLTLGPATGVLLAQLMTGETPFCDAAPFSAERF